MQYFNETEGKPEMIGRVLGDACAALVYIALLVLMLTHFV
jgi:hypothetical protein